MLTLGEIFEFVPVAVDPNPNHLQDRVRERIEAGGKADIILVDLSFDSDNSPEAVNIGRKLAIELRTHFHSKGTRVGVYTKHRLRLRQRAFIAQDAFSISLEELRMMLDGPEALQGDDWLELLLSGSASISDSKTADSSSSESPSRAKLFVGCSTESLKIAEAVQENLEHDLLVVLWTQAEFKPSFDTLTSLLAELKSSNFALFVLAPDDVVRIRGRELGSTRDNVIFELGLFIGRHGRERTFLLCPRGGETLHLPTDLLGVTPIGYDGSQKFTDEVARAVVGAACTKIKRAIRSLGS
ncbi:MAG TPA: nucleotide-binding protein [Thermoanaerobaculia bacterium]|nr:nucleotide-binding protein [Thermoanaerobaculia bacterium]